MGRIINTASFEPKKFQLHPTVSAKIFTLDRRLNYGIMEKIWKKRKQKDTPIEKKVFVGLSGGVDSSVSAALLKKAGYDVTAVFIEVWQPDWLECNWKEDRRDAMRVAAHLRIPFVTLNLQREYKQGVIDYMLAEYEAGRTPNPDVMCNREVKFGAFWDWAKKQGADLIATGHYARVISAEEGEADSGAKYSLLAGNDKNKDQSYFLWTLTQDDLSHTLFPVGHLQKAEVRKLARKFKLPNAEKKDSQGLCFMGKVDLKGFLAHYLEAEEGNVLDEKGEIIGTHPGALFFTIGERHGFTVNKKTPNGTPYYVTDKDIEQNTITVSNKRLSETVTVETSGASHVSPGTLVKTSKVSTFLPGAVKEVHIEHVNWISGHITEVGPQYKLLARSRYRQPLERARIASANFSETTVEFEGPQNALAPGQSLVVYDGEECLGGGVIS